MKDSRQSKTKIVEKHSGVFAEWGEGIYLKTPWSVLTYPHAIHIGKKNRKINKKCQGIQNLSR
jgi:hypothetical protein